MFAMIELSENELEVIAGGVTIPSVNVNVQNNIAVIPQVAIATAVLTRNSPVTAVTEASALQLNGVSGV
jgi:hypothetical protein